MLVFYAAKGGVGCSVTAAGAALASADHRPTLLVDLGGDQAHILGVEPAPGPGLATWLAADGPDPDLLRRLEQPIVAGLDLVALVGPAPEIDDDRWALLAAVLAAEERTVIVDLGTMRASRLLRLATTTVLVTSACYVALRAADSTSQPDRVVLVAEAGRALTADDVERAIGAPVACRVRWDPAIARAVDAGVLTQRRPKALRELGRL